MLLTSVHQVRFRGLLIGIPVSGDLKGVVAVTTSRRHLRRSHVMHLVDANPS